MYRRSSLHPRASTFASSVGHGGYLSAVQGCVSHAESCQELLEDSLAELQTGTQDMSRLAKILQNTRLFVLIDEPTLRQAQDKIAEEIEPQVSKLTFQGEKAIEKLEKLEHNLKLKVDTLKTRASVAAAGDKHAGAPLQVRNEVRKTQLLMKQRAMLEKELAALQQEIDDLELQVISVPRTTAGGRLGRR